MILLSVRSLTRRYGRTTALEAVDLDIPAEGRTAVVGPSGSGKTTLLRLIAGFDRPDAGTIDMAGRTLADGSTFIPAHRRSIGYVSQDGALFPHLTVGRNIGFAIPRGVPGREASISRLLELVQLDPALAVRQPHELSGGQQQRVALARTLAAKPRLIVFDEPFSALDAGLRESLRKEVGAVLAEAGIATVLVTHDQAEALSFATHLAVLREGRLGQAGAPRELYLAPRDPALATFLGDALILPATLGGDQAVCVLGHVPAPADGRRGEATIMVRPEQLALKPAPSSTRGGVALAIVTGVTFAGAASTVELRWAESAVAAGPSGFTCRVPGAAPTVGDRFFVTMTGTAHVFG